MISQFTKAQNSLCMPTIVLTYTSITQLLGFHRNFFLFHPSIYYIHTYLPKLLVQSQFPPFLFWKMELMKLLLQPIHLGHHFIKKSTSMIIFYMKYFHEQNLWRYCNPTFQTEVSLLDVIFLHECKRKQKT